jgi:hypothetical protein
MYAVSGDRVVAKDSCILQSLGNPLAASSQ